MPEEEKTQRAVVPILKIEDLLIVSFQRALHDKDALQLQDDVTKKIIQTNAKGLILDVTGLEIADSFISRTLIEIGESSKILGVKTALVGIRPEIAITMVEFGVKLEGITTALNMDKAVIILKKQIAKEAWIRWT